MTRLRPPLSLLAVSLALGVARASQADEFVAARYDPHGDALVVTLQYDGTNPDHGFTVKWGSCKSDASAGPQLTAEVLDSQWNDAARKTFTKKVRFALGSVPCRPARVTLYTAPHFEITVGIPKAPGVAP